MSDIIIFDTSVLVDDLRTGRHQHRIGSLKGLIRSSSVVLAELWRGATNPSEKKFLQKLGKNHPVLTPTRENWLESGSLLARIHRDLGFEPHKLRDIHFDVLIALTVRSYGARLITSNGADFLLIRRYRKFELEIW